jgi:FKBP-type peptidyl-prolyl cis-trans isomerase FkpA
VTVARFFRRASAVVACAVLTAGASGCGNSPAAPSSSAPFSQTDIQAGTGAQAVSGSSVTVNYTGWLYDGSKADLKGLQFDTSVGKDAFTFVLGAGQVIAGFDRGLVGMLVGGKRRLVIPPSLGYGTLRSGPLPPYATLVFDIELISVQ